MSRPTVLLVNWRDTRHPEGGGSERYVERMARRARAAWLRRDDPVRRAQNAPADEVVRGVRFRRRGGRLTVYPWAMLAIARSRPDVIVDVQNGVPFFSRLVARCPVLVLVHHVHREQWRAVLGPVLGRFGWLVESRLAPWLYRKCDYLTVSEMTRTELDRLGVAAARTTVVHNGLDPAPRTRAARDPDPTLVLVGRLVPHKQVEHAIDVVARLATRWPKLRLEVVGQGWWLENLRRARGTAGRAGPGDAARLGRRAGQARDHRPVVAARVPFGQGGLGRGDHGSGRARRAVDRLPCRGRRRRVHCGWSDRLAGRPISTTSCATWTVCCARRRCVRRWARPAGPTRRRSTGSRAWTRSRTWSAVCAVVDRAGVITSPRWVASSSRPTRTSDAATSSGVAPAVSAVSASHVSGTRIRPPSRSAGLKRTSPSTMSRMSSALLRNIRVRSTPMPKAKPL